MGLFSILNVEGTCAYCNKNSDLKIQFKYGKLWAYYDYQLNDEIIWDEKNKEMRMLELVVLDGIDVGCECCNEDADMDYLIFVEKGVIKSIKKNEGEYDFVQSNASFLILES